MPTRLPHHTGLSSTSPRRPRASASDIVHAAGLESLEQRTLMGADPFTFTAQEVYFAELVNRARANPTVEAQRLGTNLSFGLTPGEAFLLNSAKEPLALIQTLTLTARAHSADMAARNFFDHNNPSGFSPTQRARAAGYDGTVGENIGAGHATIDAAYRAWMLNPTQRKNILSLYTDFSSTYHYDHIGFGTAPGTSGSTYTSYFTADFGNPSLGARSTSLLGVVFADADSNAFYGLGEGKAGVRIDVATLSAPDSILTTLTTPATGYYQIPIAAGQYRVRYTDVASGRTAVRDVSVSDKNVRVAVMDSELQVPTPPDDFANSGQFNLATRITINQTTGNGSILGGLQTTSDTDLFRFTAAKTGLTAVVVTVTGGALSAQIRMFNAGGTAIGLGTRSGSSASIALNLTAGQDYFVQIEGAGTLATGTYALTITAPEPIPDDFASAGQFDLAARITVHQATGNASISGELEVSSDTDLFRFTAAKTGLTTIGANVTSGALSAQLRVFNALGSPIALGTRAGASASVAVNLTTGQDYFVQIEAAGTPAPGEYAIALTAPVDTGGGGTGGGGTGGGDNGGGSGGTGGGGGSGGGDNGGSGGGGSGGGGGGDPVDPAPIPDALLVAQNHTPATLQLSGGRSFVAFLNRDNRLIAAQRDASGTWSSTDLVTTVGGPVLSGKLVAWTDPKDSNVYVAATSTAGLTIYQRAASGEWSLRNLTAEIRGAAPLMRSLTVLIDAAGLVQLVGQAEGGALMSYWQNGARTTPGWRFMYTNITNRDLRQQNIAMPALVGDLTPLVGQDNRLYLASLDAQGRVMLFSRQGGGGASRMWGVTNVTAAARGPRFAGALTATTGPNSSLLITGVISNGNIWSFTSRPGQGWSTTNISRAANQPALIGASLSSYRTTNAGCILTLNAAGQTVVYRFTIARGVGRWVASNLSAPLPGAPVLAGRLSASALNNAVSITGMTASGALISLTWSPTSPWTMVDVSGALNV